MFGDRAVEVGEDGSYRFRFWTTSRLLKAAIFAIGCLLFASGFIYYQQGEVEDQLDSIELDREIGRENGYRSRAQTCRVQLALALPLMEPCLEDEVVEYYDPEERGLGSSFRADTLTLLCRLVVTEGLELPPECS